MVEWGGYWPAADAFAGYIRGRPANTKGTRMMILCVESWLMLVPIFILFFAGVGFVYLFCKGEVAWWPVHGEKI